jgi:hypothetical protein
LASVAAARRRSAVLLLVGAFAFAGFACGGDGAGDGDAETLVPAEAFEGLPPDVVSERLSDPAFVQGLETDPPQRRARVAQLNVASTVFCRDTYAAYVAWVETGETPDPPTVVRPSSPEDGFDDFMEAYRRSAEEAIESGDPAMLRRWLLQQGAGCASIVVDAAEPTRRIEDALGS